MRKRSDRKKRARVERLVPTGEKYDTNPFIARMLDVLDEMIDQRGLTQLQIQAELGWGKSYISQMRHQRKGLQVDPLLKILMVIGVEPSHYFAKAFAAVADAASSDPVVAELLKKMTATQDMVCGLVRLMVTKDVVSANEAADLIDELRTASGPASI